LSANARQIREIAECCSRELFIVHDTPPSNLSKTMNGDFSYTLPTGPNKLYRIVQNSGDDRMQRQTT
jgi:hypothetical protein